MKLHKHIIDSIEKASELTQEINELKAKIEKYFERKGIDPENLPGGCNSDNFIEMIHCYIDYGEDPIEEIIRIYEEETKWVK